MARVVVHPRGTDVALVKTKTVVDTSVYTPVCLPLPGPLAWWGMYQGLLQEQISLPETSW